ncbi:MAG: outer membrane protein transport protein [Bacteroidales bacterium]|nr:outer membrane protein transport protein [Bacteroidales bacterium]
MKRIYLIILVAFSGFSGIIAQNVDDALRYSQVFYGGTARFMSMGGAFTALGGDMSTLSQNPAGLGVFRSSEISITPQLFHINTESGFNGLSSDYLYNFNLNQAGIVSNLISNKNENGLVALNFGYSFNKTNNLNQSIRIKGIGIESSMADSWADDNSYYNTYYTDLTGVARLAYDAWVMDTITGSGGTSYGTAFSNYGDNSSVYGQSIKRLVSYEGYTGEHAISIGGNFSNKIFFGATLGISRLKYTSHYEHLESTDAFLPSGLKSFTYTDHYENTGTGVSLKLGAIIKPVEALRIGFAFHSPTLYHINEYLYEDMSSNFTDGDHYDYSDTPSRYSYNLRTPFRALFGVAYQVKKIALLSADYEFVDYSTARFSESGDNYDYSFKNEDIKTMLKLASNVRLGAEFRIDKLYLRTGYGYYGKAFKAGEDNQDLSYNSISFGTGFRDKNVSIDFGYTRMMNSQNYIMYYSDAETAAANLDIFKNMFTVTFGYKFGY